MNTAIIRLVLVLLLGICSGFYVEPPLKIIFLALLFGSGLFIFAFLRAKKLLFPDIFFGSCTLLLLFLLGHFTAALHLPQNQPNHYLNQISAEKEQEILHLSISESLKPDLFNQKYIAEVKALNRKNSNGKILLLIPEDSVQASFLEGQELIAIATPEAIPSPLNPHQFDYSQFMARKGVYQQLDLSRGVFDRLPRENSGIKMDAAQFRRQITAALQKNGFAEDELAIVQALLLGQKQDISRETYNNFAAAGAIHILAVSGLHVGIFLLLLNWILAPLKRLKRGKVLKTLLVILCLWGFATLAGLSPSVVRAVTMFSFIAVGLEIKRRTGTLNSIFLSLMLLLLVRPQWIFEVGFQLSYASVTSIVLFQPLLAGIYTPTTKISKYFYGLFTVTLAAQVGVLPLSLYYFHQFPGLFFLSNLLILPFLGIILASGILVILLSLIGVLPGFFAVFFRSTIETLNLMVALIAEQEQFLFKNIPFDSAEVWAWYLLIFSVFLLWKFFSYRKLVAALISIVILQGVYIFQEIEKEDNLIIFHRSRTTLVAKTESGQLQLYHNSPQPVEETSLIKNYVVGERIGSVCEEPLKNVYFQKGHFLILLDSTGILPEEVPFNYHLLLSGSPRINLERVLQETRPVMIIADASNYRSIIDRWKATAREKEIPFHFTGEKGAYNID